MGVGITGKVQRCTNRAPRTTASGYLSMGQDEAAEMGPCHKAPGLYPKDNEKSLMDERQSRRMK